MILGGASQEAHPFFKSPDRYPSSTGRTLVARNASEGQLLVAVQPDRHFFSPGGNTSLKDLTKKPLGAGATDAVGLDGSASVFVFFAGGFLLKPTADKDVRNLTACGFSYEPRAFPRPVVILSGRAPGTA
jgi:hypothetical protein